MLRLIEKANVFMERESLKRLLKNLAIISIVIIALAAVYHFWSGRLIEATRYFENADKLGKESLGLQGDYIGGTFNPHFAFMTSL